MSSQSGLPPVGHAVAGFDQHPVPVRVHRMGFRSPVHHGQPQQVALRHLNRRHVRVDLAVDGLREGGNSVQEPELAVQDEGCLPGDDGVRHAGHRRRDAVAQQVEIGTVDEDQIRGAVRCWRSGFEPQPGRAGPFDGEIEPSRSGIWNATSYRPPAGIRSTLPVTGVGPVRSVPSTATTVNGVPSIEMRRGSASVLINRRRATAPGARSAGRRRGRCRPP